MRVLTTRTGVYLETACTFVLDTSEAPSFSVLRHNVPVNVQQAAAVVRASTTKRRYYSFLQASAKNIKTCENSVTLDNNYDRSGLAVADSGP